MALLGKGHKGMYLSVAFAFGTCIGIRFDGKGITLADPSASSISTLLA